MSEQQPKPDIQPMPPTEGMTPDQEDLVDLYANNHGLTYGEAKRLAGVAIEDTVTVVPVPPVAAPKPKKRPNTTNRRPLTARQKLISDEPPKHIRDQHR